MTSSLDKSLDDLIKTNKKSKSGGRGEGARRRTLGPEIFQRFKVHGAARTAPRSKPLRQAPEAAWQHDMFMDYGGAAQAGRAASIETGIKLVISNLDYGVCSEDIKELFSEIGDIKRHTVHYDRSGWSKGTAEVVYSQRSDAIEAIKKYHNIQLDGKPMKIDFAMTKVAPPAASAVHPRQKGSFRSRRRGGAIGRSRSGASNGGRASKRGHGQGEGQGKKEKISAEGLDADLDKYHSEAMQTN